ncbi:MAG: ATP-binding protein [Verrucomicrobiae bacterium]|nr:ATP-binding protein [Verrucomicrobiae bacterium]
MALSGRKREIESLNRLLASGEAEFLALYGRRRIGKTFLIREHFKTRLCFELTGTKDATLPEQLANFHHALAQCSRKRREVPGSWQEAFQQLSEHLQTLRGQGKRVIFLDELPWLAGPRSRFLPALDHFWNSELSKDPRNILVVCGSAASWMIAKVIDEKGGLHNRITARLKLEPFTLGESARFLASRKVKLTPYDQLVLAMVMGGVPHYLKEAQPGNSAAQIIDRCCFSDTGLLRDEFDRLYASLFDHSERHVALVRELARHPQGLTRSDLTTAYGTGGRLTQTLRELEEAGFVSTQDPFEKKKKDTIYRLADEYSLFYLRWIEGRRQSGAGTFLKKIQSPGWRAWSGYALESLAHKHIRQIKQALGIAEVDTEHGSWVHRPDDIWPEGAQIDLLLDRADNTVNLFELKFSQGPFTITKDYAGHLRRKLETFKGVTGTRKNVFLTFLTTHGVTENAYATELVHQSLTTDSLFSEGL